MSISFLKSVIWGSSGSYNILGIPVNFGPDLPPRYLFEPAHPPYRLQGAGPLSRLADQCPKNKLFCWGTNGYFHAVVHEMSHALTFKWFTGVSPAVNVSTNDCQGETCYSDMSTLTSWKQTLINVSGPMGDIAFSATKLIAASALKSYLTWPVALAVGSGEVIWISGELLYAYVSGSRKDRGDFGRIAESGGNMHLVLSSAALVGACFSGIAIAIKLAS
jgi:hypothetical protein